MVQNVNKLTTRAQQQIDEVDQMLQVLRVWLGRADRLVHQAATSSKARFLPVHGF